MVLVSPSVTPFSAYEGTEHASSHALKKSLSFLLP
jgi:hypothetical protein